MSVPTALPADPAGPKTGAQAIERAIAILGCFDGPADVGVSEIADRVGITVSTAHRIVRALVAGGLLGQDPTTERYHLGLTTAVLGQLALDRLSLSGAAPRIEALAATTGEAVGLGVRVGDDVMVVLHVASPQPLRFEQRAGARVPLHVSSMGKVLLAFGPQPPPLDHYTYRRFTDRSITSAPRSPLSSTPFGRRASPSTTRSATRECAPSPCPCSTRTATRRRRSRSRHRRCASATAAWPSWRAPSTRPPTSSVADPA